MVEALAKFVTDGIAALGYTGIIWIMAVDGAGFPLPSVIIMPFAGSLVHEGRLNFHAVVFSGAFGTLLGSIVAYAVGYYGGRPFLVRFGRYIFVRERELALAERFFMRYGPATVFISMMLPMVRNYISMPAGIAKMRFPLFCALIFLGALLWCYLLTYAGIVLGENWIDIAGYTHIMDFVIAGAILAFIGRWLWQRFGRRPAMS